MWVQTLVILLRQDCTRMKKREGEEEEYNFKWTGKIDDKRKPMAITCSKFVTRGGWTRSLVLKSGQYLSIQKSYTGKKNNKIWRHIPTIHLSEPEKNQWKYVYFFITTELHMTKDGYQFIELQLFQPLHLRNAL